MHVVVGVYLVLFGAYLIVRPESFIARVRRDPFRNRVLGSADDTAYGRRLQRVEPTHVRIIGAGLLLIGAITATGLT